MSDMTKQKFEQIQKRSRAYSPGELAELLIKYPGVESPLALRDRQDLLDYVMVLRSVLIFTKRELNMLYGEATSGEGVTIARIRRALECVEKQEDILCLRDL